MKVTGSFARPRSHALVGAPRFYPYRPNPIQWGLNLTTRTPQCRSLVKQSG